LSEGGLAIPSEVMKKGSMGFKDKKQRLKKMMTGAHTQVTRGKGARREKGATTKKDVAARGRRGGGMELQRYRL